MSLKNASHPIVLAGKVYELRFDIQALTSAHAAMKALGFTRGTVWTLADAPYDLGEELMLLHAGLNGSKRLNKDKEMYDMDEVQELLQKHFDVMSEEISAIEDEKEAMEEFQKRQQALMESISDAVKSAIGFRYKGKRDRPGKKTE